MTSGRWGTDLGDECQEDEEAGSDDGLLVDNIEFLRDGGREEASAKNDAAGFGDEAGGGGHLVDELGGALGGRRGVGRARHAPAIIHTSKIVLMPGHCAQTHGDIRDNSPRHCGDRLGSY